jgi:hypothetical protein
MLVAVDKFTKWVEAAPVTTQDSTAAINFIKSILQHLRRICSSEGTGMLLIIIIAFFAMRSL